MVLAIEENLPQPQVVPSTLQHLIIPNPTSRTLPPSSTWMKRRAYYILTQLTGLMSPTAVHQYHREEGQMLPSSE